MGFPEKNNYVILTLDVLVQHKIPENILREIIVVIQGWIFFFFRFIKCEILCKINSDELETIPPVLTSLRVDLEDLRRIGKILTPGLPTERIQRDISD